ncbi:hypothetical protein KI688_000714 [Linnemannia hyalina]|uniref:Uncharacterized protein n=1 Tax=Linnemannia hyalina TaxID=64524 RepID=A0A9P7Y5Y1_9FUNG|nr:hypothetical protein KI688_000714 [Linnemannia hyalina]
MRVSSRKNSRRHQRKRTANISTKQQHSNPQQPSVMIDTSMHDVQLRVLNGYIAHVYPRLRNILIRLPPLCSEGGIPERSALQLRLESSLCLLARLECLERQHYRLHPSECDLWALNYSFGLGAELDRQLDQKDTDKGLLTVREQPKTLGLILDVVSMSARSSSTGIGSEFEQAPVQEIRHLFASKWGLFR